MTRSLTVSRRIVITGLAGLVARPVWAEGRVHIFAASSLKPALDELFESPEIALSYGGSGLLARQIKSGAPADIFISANPLWMDQIKTQTARRDLLGNRLVLVGRDQIDLRDMNAGTRIVTGLTEAVPLGQYARQAMENMGVWDALSPSLIQVENARLAVTLVEREEVPFGLVYASDAVGLARAQIIQEIPPETHDPIRYPAALIEAHAQPIYDRLFTPQAAAIFARHGFEVL